MKKLAKGLLILAGAVVVGGACGWIGEKAGYSTGMTVAVVLAVGTALTHFTGKKSEEA